MIIGLDAKRFFTNATGLGTYARTTIQALARYEKDLRLVLFTPQLGGPFAQHVPTEALVISPRLARHFAHYGAALSCRRTSPTQGCTSTTVCLTSFPLPHFPAACAPWSPCMISSFFPTRTATQQWTAFSTA